jgi:hypothetical protein
VVPISACHPLFRIKGPTSATYIPHSTFRLFHRSAHHPYRRPEDTRVRDEASSRRSGSYQFKQSRLSLYHAIGASSRRSEFPRTVVGTLHVLICVHRAPRARQISAQASGLLAVSVTSEGSFCTTGTGTGTAVQRTEVGPSTCQASSLPRHLADGPESGPCAADQPPPKLATSLLTYFIAHISALDLLLATIHRGLRTARLFVLRPARQSCTKASRIRTRLASSSSRRRYGLHQTVPPVYMDRFSVEVCALHRKNVR